MNSPGAVITCSTVVLVGSAVALRSARPTSKGPGARTELEDWALAGRGQGSGLLWCLLGGTVYTAYTFTAVPGAVFTSGGIGFYALPYTMIICAIGFVLLPRLAATARAHGHVTVADFVRVRYGSSLLALAVALTGIFALMPYIALQLLGLRAVLSVLGMRQDGLMGDAALTAVFAVLAVSTYRYGLRAPTLVSVVKAGLVVGATVAVAGLVMTGLGSPADLFARADAAFAAQGGTASLVPDPSLAPAYVSLAVGSALALFAFPHVLQVAFSARSGDVLRRTSVTLFGWTAMLGLFALFGIAALAAGVSPPPGRSELAVPLLVLDLAPGWAAGLILGAIVVAALVPAAVMSIGAATLFARNVYLEFVNPTATVVQVTRMARLMSLVVKVGALVFALGVRDQAAINLHLLGAVWVLQILPSIVLGLLHRTPHRVSLLAGWLSGMVVGTALVSRGGFSSLVRISFGPLDVQVYAGVVGLVVNLLVVTLASPLLDRLGVPRGLSGLLRTDDGAVRRNGVAR
ncbi:sodium:solute symporter family protein [Streptomyces ardesiacus]|uniref:sodium:solute symporter family protein n=1 Tax=Streptomyces ardesiacus TaxID=285564 RepID=UPI00201E7CDE|nr:sodium:solute symporter [Streptomyces ardesiacus]MCL7370213.1 sodium:solute symporter [Streptomyces ardesiacus]